MKLLVATMLIGLVSSVALAEDAYQVFKRQPDAQNALAYLHQVATHPRCANCHGVVENGVHHPTVGDERVAHPMNISSANNLRLTVKDGEFVQLPHPLAVNCRTCHQNQNGDEPGMPPGAANDLMKGFVWHMPPVTMAIERDVTRQQLCATWLDPAKNSFLAYRGGRDDMQTFKKEFEHHVHDDPLVRWAWNPGLGRMPAPGSHSDFVKAMEIWIEAGAPCA